jgi:hypothetical protein
MFDSNTQIVRENDNYQQMTIEICGKEYELQLKTNVWYEIMNDERQLKIRKKHLKQEIIKIENELSAREDTLERMRTTMGLLPSNKKRKPFNFKSKNK